MDVSSFLAGRGKRGFLPGPGRLWWGEMRSELQPLPFVPRAFDARSLPQDCRAAPSVESFVHSRAGSQDVQYLTPPPQKKT